MNNSKKYRKADDPTEGSNFLSGGEISWSKSKAEVWDELQSKINEKEYPQSHRIEFRRLSIAALIILMLGFSALMRFYSVSFSTGSLVYRQAELPDGSKFELNANSDIKYYPYWWRFHRIIELNGEAFFEVEKGNKFTVLTENAEIEVLGTSFNVYSREEVLRVTCFTGKISIESPSSPKQLVLPGGLAEVKKEGNIELKEEKDTYEEVAWRNRSFYFTATPATEVFSRFEEQYGVSINSETEISLVYTGNFRIENNVETVLEYVCPALGLKYEKEDDGTYLILESDE